MSKFLSFKTLMAIVFIFAIAGCKKDKPEKSEDPIAINLRADISRSTLKVASDQWEANDKVGLYMKPTGQPLSAAYGYARNLQMNIDGEGKLVFDQPIYYPESGNVDFIAYYPYTADVGSDFTIDVNVAGQAAGLPTEILRSDNVKNQVKTESAVKLEFFYSLAKLEITVTGGTSSALAQADFDAMTATINGMFTQAKLQLADGTFTDKSAIQTITLHKKESTNSSAKFEALIIPSTVIDGEITFMFNVNGVFHSYKQPTNYTSHNLYRLNFALDFPTATLLNTDIIPRNQNPIENITIPPVVFEPEMVYVEGGTFTMGWVEGRDGTDDSFLNAKPSHQVTLSSFSIGKNLVTQAMWEAVMGTTISQQRDLLLPSVALRGVGDNYPMYYVCWNDIVGTSGASMVINGITYLENGFIYKLNELTGKQYRLPTESEWEFAARGGNKSQNYMYSGSNNINDVAWYAPNINDSIQPVGTKQPNELGIYDMSGNLSELCSDWFLASYTSDAKNNPTGPTGGTLHVLRGGQDCRVANRSNIWPNFRSFHYGFRLVLPL